MDWFTSVVYSAKAEIPKDVEGIGVDCAEEFLRVGGMMSWREWSSLDTGTRQMFMDASDRLWSHRIAALAMTLYEVLGGNAGDDADEPGDKAGCEELAGGK